MKTALMLVSILPIMVVFIVGASVWLARNIARELL